MTLKQYGYMALITLHTFGLMVSAAGWYMGSASAPLFVGLNVSCLVVRTLQLLETRPRS